MNVSLRPREPEKEGVTRTGHEKKQAGWLFPLEAWNGGAKKWDGLFEVLLN